MAIAGVFELPSGSLRLRLISDEVVADAYMVSFAAIHMDGHDELKPDMLEDSARHFTSESTMTVFSLRVPQLEFIRICFSTCLLFFSQTLTTVSYSACGSTLPISRGNPA